MNPDGYHTGDVEKLALDGTDYRSWEDVGKAFHDAVCYRNSERKARRKSFWDVQTRRDGRRKLR